VSAACNETDRLEKSKLKNAAPATGPLRWGWAFDTAEQTRPIDDEATTRDLRRRSTRDSRTRRFVRQLALG
jgi:hypothetical protein